MTEVPLADTGGFVTCIAQYIRDRHFIGVQSVGAVGKQNGPHTEPLVVTAGHQGSSRAGTDRAADIEMIELHALACHLIKIGSLRARRAVESNISITHVVDENNNHVGPLGGNYNLTDYHTEQTQAQLA